MEHQMQFAAVTEYEGLWKPKHHLALHIARDIRRFGPPRGYWCMAFEAFNQLVKRLSEMSNYKSQLSSVVNFWLYKSARNLIKGTSASWAASEVCVVGEATLDDARASTSPLLKYIAHMEAPVHSINILCSFTRGGDVIREGDWITYAMDGDTLQQQMLMLIEEIVEVVPIKADADAQSSNILLLGFHMHAPAPCVEKGGLMVLPEALWARARAQSILYVSLRSCKHDDPPNGSHRPRMKC